MKTRSDRSNKLTGYTLMEVLLSISLVAMVSGLSVPIFQSALYRNQIDTSSLLAVRAIKTAQTFAKTAKNDSAWGVFFSTNKITVYQGGSYFTRDNSADQEYDITGVSVSGLSEINYAKLSGLPSGTGIINITAQNNTKSINVNAKGTVSY